MLRNVCPGCPHQAIVIAENVSVSFPASVACVRGKTLAWKAQANYPLPKERPDGFFLMASLCTKLKGGVNGSVKFK